MTRTNYFDQDKQYVVYMMNSHIIIKINAYRTANNHGGVGAMGCKIIGDLLGIVPHGELWVGRHGL